MVNNKLNIESSKKLFNDILTNNVKRLGTFYINKYRLTIYDTTNPSGTQRVMALYGRRKSKGLCVSCGKIKVKNFVRCKQCRDLQNFNRRKK